MKLFLLGKFSFSESIGTFFLGKVSGFSGGYINLFFG